MSVRAVTPVRLWKFPRDRFERLAAECPSFALAVATSAVRMLHLRERQFFIVTLVAIALSLPFWSAIGVLAR